MLYDINFPEMKRQIAKAYPHLNDKAVTYAVNKISNKMRKWNNDSYAMRIGDAECAIGGGYWSYFDVEASGTKIQIGILVD